MSAARPPQPAVRPTVLGLAVLLAATLLSLAGTTTTPAAAAGPGAVSRASQGEDFPTFPARCMVAEDRPADVCRITTYPKRPWLLLWGDSHALQYLAPVKTLAKRHRINLVSIYSGGCPLSVPYPASAGQPTMTCDRHNATALRYARDLVASGRRVKIVLGSFWAVYRDTYAQLEESWRTGEPSGLSPYQTHHAMLAVERSAALFRAVGRMRASVDVLAQAPWVPSDARRCPAGRTPYLCDLPRSRSLPDEAGNARFLARRIRMLRGPVRLIDPSPVVCDRRQCHGRVDGLNTWYDEAHLGMAMTRRMTSYFRPTVRDLVRPRR